MVLEIDQAKRRVSLGLKQTMRNPWEVFSETHPEGTQVEGEVKNITEFGLFVGLDGDIDGLVHLSDLDWSRPGEEALKDFRKGDMVKAVVLDVDVEKERISLGIKQLDKDPFTEATQDLRRGQTVTCTVTKVVENGLEISTADGAKGFIRKSEIARDRQDQRTDRYSEGDKFDALITNIDRSSRKLTLSIKALEMAEEKKAMAEFGSSDSGASLGDILGAALRERERTQADD